MPDIQEFCEYTGCGSRMIGLRCSKFGHLAESRPAKSEQVKDQVATELDPVNPPVPPIEGNTVIAEQG